MKVLFVCPAVPWPLDSGGRIRTYHLVRCLAEQAEIHLRVVLEPGAGEAELEPLREVCASVRGYERGRPGRWQRLARPKIERWVHSPALCASLREEVAGAGYDVVHLDELALARVLPVPSPVPVVVHHHKLDTLLYECAPLAPGWPGELDLWKLRQLERAAARRWRHHVLCSELDAGLLQARHAGLECSVVPSGFDPEHFRPSAPPPPREEGRLLYLGSMSYAPNVDAVLHFARDVLPVLDELRPGVRLDVVGREPAREVRALNSERVRVVGPVDDVRPHLERAAAVVVPLRIGGGTRLKIVEALALGCPLVSTPVGAEGLELEDGVHLRLAEGARGFARATADLLADPAAAAELGRRGRQQVHERYRWSNLAPLLLEAWQRAAASRPGVRATP